MFEVVFTSDEIPTFRQIRSMRSAATRDQCGTWQQRKAEQAMESARWAMRRRRIVRIADRIVQLDALTQTLRMCATPGEQRARMTIFDLSGGSR